MWLLQTNKMMLSSVISEHVKINLMFNYIYIYIYIKSNYTHIYIKKITNNHMNITRVN